MSINDFDSRTERRKDKMITIDSDCREVFSFCYFTNGIEMFLQSLFPPLWYGVVARIIESGAVLASEQGPAPWAPRWTPIPLTIRHGKSDFETQVKSCIFRAHDCIHQLWGLPVPSTFSESEFYVFKRAQMCGEIAVLTIVEFGLCKLFLDRFPHDVELREVLMRRNALPMLEPQGALHGKSLREVATRLDDLLHKQRRPKWVRDSVEATAFCNDYVPMLEADRKDIDHNWKVMQSSGWIPKDAPNSRYGWNLDGLELTLWMIDDFQHLLSTDVQIDHALAFFNRARRSRIQLPNGWHAQPQR